MWWGLVGCFEPKNAGLSLFESFLGVLLFLWCGWFSACLVVWFAGLFVFFGVFGCVVCRLVFVVVFVVGVLCVVVFVCCLFAVCLCVVFLVLWVVFVFLFACCLFALFCVVWLMVGGLWWWC